MTDQEPRPDWTAAVGAALAETARRGEQYRRERAGEADEQQRACEARRAEAEAASGGQPLTLTRAIGAALAERIARGETRQRELHQHYGYGDREPGRAGR